MWAHLNSLLIAGNVDIMVFFTVAVAPTIFTVLPPQRSAAFESIRVFSSQKIDVSRQIIAMKCKEEPHRKNAQKIHHTL